MKIIVVGAGTAGLAAVHTLHRMGVGVTCLEAGDHPGGRTRSLKRDGYTLDIGAQFFFKSYAACFDLCAELGLGDDLHAFPYRVGFPHNGAGPITPVLVTTDPRQLVRNAREYLAFKGVPLRASWQMLPVMATILRRRNDLIFTDFERMLDLDDESLAAFTRRRGGREALECVMQPLSSCMTLGEPEDMGAGYGLALMWNNINGLKTLNQGIGALSERLYAPCRDSIHLATPVKRIVIEDCRVKGVQTADAFLEADAVICATTATTALQLMPDLPEALAEPLRRVTYSACCHVMFALEKRLLPPDWYAIALPRSYGSPLTGFTDSSIKSPSYAPPGAGLIHCFTFGRHAMALNALSESEIIRTLVSEIQRWQPRMPDEPVFCEIQRISEAVCLSPPGMLRAMAGLRRHHAGAVDGLYLAGEYLYMPSVEGALTSGREAACAVGKECKSWV